MAKHALSTLAGLIQDQMNDAKGRKGHPCLLFLIQKALLGYKCHLVVGVAMSEKRSAASLQPEESNSKCFRRRAPHGKW